MKNIALLLPKTEAEADQRLLRVLKMAVEEKGWPLQTVRSMLLTQLRDLSDFDEKTWPFFLSTLETNYRQVS